MEFSLSNALNTFHPRPTALKTKKTPGLYLGGWNPFFLTGIMRDECGRFGDGWQVKQVGGFW